MIQDAVLAPLGSVSSQTSEPGPEPALAAWVNMAVSSQLAACLRLGGAGDGNAFSSGWHLIHAGGDLLSPPLQPLLYPLAAFFLFLFVTDSLFLFLFEGTTRSVA